MIGEICARQCRIENFEGHARSCDVRVDEVPRRRCSPRRRLRDLPARRRRRRDVHRRRPLRQRRASASGWRRRRARPRPVGRRDRGHPPGGGRARASALPDLDAILHGTTVATNAVLERRGALVGLIVTKGFRHDPPPRRGVDAGAAVRLHGLREARAADRHPLRPRGARADGRRRGDRRADRRGGRSRSRRGARRRRRRGADRLPAQRPRERAPRARRRRDRRLRRSRPAGVDLVRDPSRVPRVRAHRDDADERVRRAGAREVPDERPRRSRGRAACGRRSRSCGRTAG